MTEKHMMGKKSFISLTKFFFIVLERSYKKNELCIESLSFISFNPLEKVGVIKAKISFSESETKLSDFNFIVLNL